MNIKYLILLLINNLEGEISTKNEIHGILYFYSLIYKKELRYKPHYYGPYSPEVEHALDELQGIGLLNVNEKGIINHREFEVVRYNYSISKFGKEVLERSCLSHQGEIKEMEDFISKLKEASISSYFELSIASKAYYILKREKKAITRDSVARIIQTLDWCTTQEELCSIVNFLDSLKLLKD